MNRIAFGHVAALVLLMVPVAWADEVPDDRVVPVDAPSRERAAASESQAEPEAVAAEEAEVVQRQAAEMAAPDGESSRLSGGRNWAPMKARVMRADIRHPALYYDSVQEKLANDDTGSDTCPGGFVSAAYEPLQFIAQGVATPVLLIVKPPWTLERGEP